MEIKDTKLKNANLLHSDLLSSRLSIKGYRRFAKFIEFHRKKFISKSPVGICHFTVFPWRIDIFEAKCKFNLVFFFK